MTCFHPLEASKSPSPDSRGKYLIRWDDHPSIRNWERIKLPCGQCIGCLLDRSQQWAIRVVKEARQYENNCFVTLTFSDDGFKLRAEREPDLPYYDSVYVRDLQLFLKRLRKQNSDVKIRFLACAEYGEKHGRAHYHLAIMNYKPDDLKLFSTRGGVSLYTSDSLSSCWPYGFVSVGDLTFESAAYVARYCTKKLNISKASKENNVSEYHRKYTIFDDQSGAILGKRKPEFNTMSRRPYT